VQRRTQIQPFARWLQIILTRSLARDLRPRVFRRAEPELRDELRKGTRERISRLLQMHANKREEIDRFMRGDICGAGLKSVNTGDTLCATKKSRSSRKY